MIWFIVALAIMSISFMVTLYPWLVPGTWTIYSGASPAVSLFTFTLAMGGFIPGDDHVQCLSDLGLPRAHFRPGGPPLRI